VSVRERKYTAAQIAEAKKAAALKAKANAKRRKDEALRTAANIAHIAAAGLADRTEQHRHEQRHVHGARAPPAVRLLSKAEVCAITGLSFPTLWKWMRQGAFPRSRVVGGHSKWLSTEVDAWLANLTVRPLKGDAPVEAVA
jgi:predicted DNA-binding transcriptional regulator AlpA